MNTMQQRESFVANAKIFLCFKMYNNITALAYAEKNNVTI